jgi:hypothetical protein
MSEGVGGEPAGKRRRRRLTLAPRPRATARRGEGEAKVSAAFFADSGGSDARGRRQVEGSMGELECGLFIRYSVRVQAGGGGLSFLGARR